jgi:transmembrane protein TMEM260 (protein O-mannosyltransferase)
MSDLRRGAVAAPAPPRAPAAPAPRAAGAWPGLMRDVALVFAASLAFYATLAAPTVLFGDSAELQAVALRGGIPHASGYPGFVLIGRLFALLPFPDPAYRITFMSAFFAAATLALLVKQLAELGVTRGAALAGALVLGASFTFWQVALRTEVYSLALFLGFLALWRTLAALRGTSLGDALVAGLLAGIALTGHLMLAPVSAVLGLTLAWHVARTQRHAIPALAALLFVFLVGLTPYLYLVWADVHGAPFNYLRLVEQVQMPDGLSADFDTPWKRLRWLLTSRGLYPASAFPFTFDATVRGITRSLLELILFELGPVALGLAAWGFARRLRVDARTTGLLGATAAAVLLFTGAIAPATHMGIFLMPATLVLAIFTASALEPVISRSAILGALALAAAVVPPHGIRMNANDHPIGRWHLRIEREDPSLAPDRMPNYRGLRAPRLYGEQALAAIPGGALVLAEWPEFANLTYFRIVERSRPDLDMQPLSERYLAKRIARWQGDHGADAPLVFLSRPPELAPDAPLDSTRLAIGRWIWIRHAPVAAPR